MYISGPGYRSQYSNSLRAERLGIETPMGATDFLFSKPVLADPETHRVSSTISNGDPRGVKRPARGFDHLPQYSAEVENWWSTTCYEVTFNLNMQLISYVRTGNFCVTIHL